MPGKVMAVVVVCTPGSQAPLGSQRRPWEGAGCAWGAGKGGVEEWGVLSSPPAEASLAICRGPDGFQQS